MVLAVFICLGPLPEHAFIRGSAHARGRSGSGATQRLAGVMCGKAGRNVLAGTAGTEKGGPLSVPLGFWGRRKTHQKVVIRRRAASIPAKAVLRLRLHNRLYV